MQTYFGQIRHFNVVYNARYLGANKVHYGKCGNGV